MSILIIVALGTAFFCGIRVTKDDMLLTADKYYDDGNLLDIRLTSLLGFTEDDFKISSFGVSDKVVPLGTGPVSA